MVQRYTRKANKLKHRQRALPVDMRCPMCFEVKTESKMWVVIRKRSDIQRFPPDARKEGAVCAACFRGEMGRVLGPSVYAPTPRRISVQANYLEWLLREAVRGVDCGSGVSLLVAKVRGSIRTVDMPKEADCE